MKKILLTGAAGFIGSNTASALLSRGDLVVGVDNLNDYYDPARKQANLEEVRAAAPDPKKFIFHRTDIRDEDAIDTLCAEHGFDASAEVFADAFAYAGFGLGHANSQARQNILAGVPADMSGHPK